MSRSWRRRRSRLSVRSASEPLSWPSSVSMRERVMLTSPAWLTRRSSSGCARARTWPGRDAAAPFRASVARPVAEGAPAWRSAAARGRNCAPSGRRCGGRSAPALPGGRAATAAALPATTARFRGRLAIAARRWPRSGRDAKHVEGACHRIQPGQQESRRRSSRLGEAEVRSRIRGGAPFRLAALRRPGARRP